jgi:hypothetical protein
MRTHFDEILQKISELENHQEKNDEAKKFEIESFMYLSLWYATLNTVIEGWQELGLKDPGIELLLQSNNSKLLKKYRHGVLHFQRNYFDQRFVGFMESNDSVEWVRNLNKEFGRYFLEYFKTSWNKVD